MITFSVFKREKGFRKPSGASFQYFHFQRMTSLHEFQKQFTFLQEKRDFDADLSRLPAFERIAQYCETKDPDALVGCTFRYVAEYLNTGSTDEDRLTITMNDWISSKTTLELLRERNVSGLDYARSLLMHKSISRAVAHCMSATQQ